MAKINLLSSKIYNRISAGEVIERPYFVVKELLENSLDANATEITVQIENGGLSLIEISDNGSGIEKSELKKAILPHATSKISTIKDLDNITSLGFRGEALASIASVSKLTIQSKPASQEFGGVIQVEGGDVISLNDCGVSSGTIISVKNLFFNAPVRAKFLRSERSEENEITNTVARFILSNPNVSFKYIADGKVIYQSYGEGLESAMACVYGVDVINQCYNVDANKHGIEIKGYLGKRHFTKGNRSYQTIFLNNRYVVNQTILSAISNAYSPYLMKKQYPFFVLSINMPTELVDVNVHPNKLDVRFQNNQIVYGAIYSTITKILDGSSETLSIVVEKQNNKQNTDDTACDYATRNGEIRHAKFNKDELFSLKKFDKLVVNDSGAKGIDLTEIKKEDKPAVDIFAENKAFLESLDKKKKEQQSVVQNEIEINRELNYVGQVLNTYLVFDDGIDLYLADQHAAHERILFDKLTESYKKDDLVTQPLLLPFILNVNNSEFDFLTNKIN
ncbi:MAG: DNA mismatch repair endonuclease MutL, partial [Clostridia bacterium]|nr:DNA mismatch repair endonuclease MutL [Clostridia bacterium]